MKVSQSHLAAQARAALSELRCILAPSKSAQVDTLFKPIGGRTADGYIVRRRKTGAEFHAFGRDFTVNKHGCVVFKSKETGRWYFPDSVSWPLDHKQTRIFVATYFPEFSTDSHLAVDLAALAPVSHENPEQEQQARETEAPAKAFPIATASGPVASTVTNRVEGDTLLVCIQVAGKTVAEAETLEDAITAARVKLENLITDSETLVSASSRFGDPIPVYDDGYGPLWIHRDSTGISGIVRAVTWSDAYEICEDEFFPDGGPEAYEQNPEEMSEHDSACWNEAYGYRPNTKRMEDGSLSSIYAKDLNGDVLDRLTPALLAELEITLEIVTEA